MKKECNRTECFGFTIEEDNNCVVLGETYRDDYACPFFKTVDEVSNMTLELIRERLESKN